MKVLLDNEIFTKWSITFPTDFKFQKGDIVRGPDEAKFYIIADTEILVEVYSNHTDKATFLYNFHKTFELTRFKKLWRGEL